MTYHFSGNVCVRICADCTHPLANTPLRLYRLKPEDAAPALSVAAPKDTFSLLDPAAIAAQADRLLAQTVTDADGNFTVVLGEDTEYGGGPFQIDCYLDQTPHQVATSAKADPVQLSITTLQPSWRQTDAGFVGAWRYCIPQRFWCQILALFDVWVVCGRVMDCKDQLPIAGVTVAAFDADWLQDDALGTAMTDGAGQFLLFFSTADFQKTPLSPLINLEWVGGPDLFFKVSTSGGVLLLDEPRSRGRDPDRENADHCTCVILCVAAPADIYTPPQFTHIGDFNISADIDPITGLTDKTKAGHGGPGFGFTGAIKLKGWCGKTLAGDPSKVMHYRFLYVDPATSIERPVTGALVAEVVVGARVVPWDQFGSGVTLSYQDIIIRGSGIASAPDALPAAPAVPPGAPWGPVPAHVLIPDSDGWVRVDQRAMDNGFQGPLLGLDTNKIVAGGNPTPVAMAGNDPAPVAAAGARLRIIFETATDPANPATHARQMIAAEPLVNNWVELPQIDIAQFHSGGLGGCTPLSSDLNILYTADHELMRTWRLQINSAAGVPGGYPVLPSGSGPRGGFGNHYVDISTWPSCSYQLRLFAQRSLTTGETDDDEDSYLVTFCK